MKFTLLTRLTKVDINKSKMLKQQILIMQKLEKMLKEKHY